MNTTIKILLHTKSGEHTIGAAQNLSNTDAPPNGNYPRLSISRLRLDRLKISEIFLDGYLHVASQKYPVQIVVEQTDEGKTYPLAKIQNAWFVAIDLVYTTTADYVIVENSVLEAEYIRLTF